MKISIFSRKGLMKKIIAQLLLLSFIFSSLGLNNLAYARNDDLYGNRGNTQVMPAHNLELEWHPPQLPIPEDPSNIELNLPEQLLGTEANLEAIGEPEINTLIEALRNKDPNIRRSAEQDLYNLFNDLQVSDPTKQKVIDALEKIATDESLDYQIKADVLLALGVISLNPQADDSIRQKVSNAFLNIATKSPDSTIKVIAVNRLVDMAQGRQANTALKEKIVDFFSDMATKTLGSEISRAVFSGLLRIALDFQVNTALKERVANSLLGLVTKSSDVDIRIAVLSGLTDIAVDPQVNASLKEKIVDLLLDMNTKTLGSDMGRVVFSGLLRIVLCLLNIACIS